MPFCLSRAFFLHLKQEKAKLIRSLNKGVDRIL